MRYLYLLVLGWLVSCGTIPSGQKSRAQDSLLWNAYKKKDTSELRQFFERWSVETPALSDAGIDGLNDTLGNVYEVYKAFYRPQNIGQLGGSEWGDSIYANVSYLILQDELHFAFADTLGIDQDADILPGSKDSIVHFRPEVGFASPKTVILTEYYDTLLNAFLGNTHLPLGAGNIMAPARSKGESADREAFLGRVVKIWYGHWGGYWQLHSYPLVGQLILDRKMESAQVYFRMVYEGGTAYLKKINGKWELVSAKRTWIE